MRSEFGAQLFGYKALIHIVWWCLMAFLIPFLIPDMFWTILNLNPRILIGCPPLHRGSAQGSMDFKCSDLDNGLVWVSGLDLIWFGPESTLLAPRARFFFFENMSSKEFLRQEIGPGSHSQKLPSKMVRCLWLMIIVLPYYHIDLYHHHHYSILSCGITIMIPYFVRHMIPFSHHNAELQSRSTNPGAQWLCRSARVGLAVTSLLEMSHGEWISLDII